MGSFTFRLLALVSLFGINLCDVISTSEVAQNDSSPIVTRLLTKFPYNSTLNKNEVHVYYRRIDRTEILALFRVSVEIVRSNNFKNETGPILEVTVSNGRDNFLLKLPVVYPNLTLFSYGKVLEPLLAEDFGPLKKRKHKPKGIQQNLIITVQSQLQTEIEYKIFLNKLDKSQYNLIFKPGEEVKTLENQHLTFVKPIGFYLDSDEQKVKSFHITATSEDDICAVLVTVPADEPLYEKRIDSNEIDNRRMITFTRRADVFFSESEVEKFKRFRIYTFINPDDSACIQNSSRKSVIENKKITFEFVKSDSQSYFLPVSLMFVFFVTPSLLLLPYLAFTKLSTTQSAPSLISFEDPPSDPPNVEIDILPESTMSSIEPRTVEIHIPDSLSLHGEMLRYPLAIILPVLMHTALEFHKWTTSSMANRDEMCFHNHACARPYGELRAWNNVISNVGFAIYGLIFVAITMGRRRRHQEKKEYGTFECTLLDVTIGVFMVLQAIASATYHICPSDVAFQFDTPCIQVICGLLIIRQWLVRLESPSAAYSNVLLVAVISLNFLVSAFSNYRHVRYLIATLHSCTIIGVCLAKRTMLTRFGATFHKKVSLAFSIVFCLANTVMIIMYTFYTFVHLNHISTYCFILNSVLYLAYYTALKSMCQEKIITVAKLYGVLAVASWAAAAYFFMQDDTDWTKSAASSRALNKPCVLLNFFGSHDLWHILGAVAGLFTFLFVSFVDDDLQNTPKHAVHLF